MNNITFINNNVFIWKFAKALQPHLKVYKCHCVKQTKKVASARIFARYFLRTNFMFPFYLTGLLHVLLYR